MADFDAKKANNDDWGVIGGGAVVLISSFLSWYGSSGEGLGSIYSASVSGWDVGFLALLAILLCTAAAAWTAFRVFGSGSTPELPVGPHLLALGMSAVGAVFILLRLVSFKRASAGGFSVGPKYGVFVALIAAAVQTFFAYRAFKASGEPLAVDQSRMPGRAATPATPAAPVAPQAGWTAPAAADAPPPAYDAPPVAMDAPPMMDPPHVHDDSDGHDHPHP